MPESGKNASLPKKFETTARKSSKGNSEPNPENKNEAETTKILEV